MERSSVWKLVAVLATLIAAAACLWLMPMQLGLDLQGGVHVVMQARPTDDTPVTRDVMERALTVIERRVNALGISEPIVQIQGADRIAIQLPGVTTTSKHRDDRPDSPSGVPGSVRQHGTHRQQLAQRAGDARSVRSLGHRNRV